MYRAMVWMVLFSMWSLGAEETVMGDPTEPSDFVSNPGKSTTQDITDESDNLQLEAIIISGSHRLAVINQKIVEVGDKLGNQHIIKIENDKVVLKADKKKEYTLPLLKVKIKDIAL